MRISKFMLPAVTVAGALALAGCGGGSGGEDPPKMMDPIVKEEEEETVDFSPATLPGTANGIVYNADSRKTILVGKGKHAVGDSNVSVMCEADTGCAYRVVASGGSVSIETTNGATVVLTNPVPQTAQPQDSGHWLSAASIIAAIPADADNGVASPDNLSFTIGGVKRTIASNPTGNAGVGTPDDKVDELVLRHDRTNADDGNFLVWGSWKEPVEGTASDKYHQVSGGSVPYKGTPPKSAGGPDSQAIYSGEDAFVGFVNGTAWVSDVRLTANFGDQTISGIVGEGVVAAGVATNTTTIGTTNVPDFNSITLKQTGIGSTMTGSATIRGIGAGTSNGVGDQRNAPSSGTWKAGFFGPGAGTPTGIAGEVNVTRPLAGQTLATADNPHGRVVKLSISGAFGAPPVGE